MQIKDRIYPERGNSYNECRTYNKDGRLLQIREDRSDGMAHYKVCKYYNKEGELVTVRVRGWVWETGFEATLYAKRNSDGKLQGWSKKHGFATPDCPLGIIPEDRVFDYFADAVNELSYKEYCRLEDAKSPEQKALETSKEFANHEICREGGPEVFNPPLQYGKTMYVISEELLAFRGKEEESYELIPEETYNAQFTDAGSIFYNPWDDRDVERMERDNKDRAEYELELEAGEYYGALVPGVLSQVAA